MTVNGHFVVYWGCSVLLMAISSPVAIYGGRMPLRQVGSLSAWARLLGVLCEVRQQSNVLRESISKLFRSVRGQTRQWIRRAACTDIKTTANMRFLSFARMPVPTTVLSYIIHPRFHGIIVTCRERHIHYCRNTRVLLYCIQVLLLLYYYCCIRYLRVLLPVNTTTINTRARPGWGKHPSPRARGT